MVKPQLRTQNLANFSQIEQIGSSQPETRVWGNRKKRGAVPRLWESNRHELARFRPACSASKGLPPTGDVRLLLTVFLGHLGSGSSVLAKAQMRHFDVGTLAIETIVGRGFRACKVRAYSPGRSECSERRPG